MHAAAISPRGGVAPKTTRFRGQSIVEYVLIIAVIGLVIVFAGPGVAGAIRNQFNLVGNTLNSGTNGGTEGDGSAGADSATVQAAVAKDAKDWTLDEQKAVAEDIAAKGEASPAYAKAKAAMDAGTEFSMKLTDGQTLTYRIIGINHDDLADGSGKAGLTFLTTSSGISSRMNATDVNTGGWEKSELRQKMNAGEIWNLMSSDFQSKVKSVAKLTNNVSGESSDAPVTATVDKLFLISLSETFDKSFWFDPSDEELGFLWLTTEGTLYEAFTNRTFDEVFDSVYNGFDWWIRTSDHLRSSHFLTIANAPGVAGEGFASESYCVCPAWCF